MLRTPAVPRTKDGKHELVFTTENRSNHCFLLRQALEGRLMGAILALAKIDSNKVRAVFSYNPTLVGYPLNKDPLGLLTGISVPYQGLIEPNGKVGEDYFIGDKLVPPYAPLFSYLSTGNIEHNVEARFDGFHIFNYADTFNIGKHMGTHFYLLRRARQVGKPEGTGKEDIIARVAADAEFTFLEKIAPQYGDISKRVEAFLTDPNRSEKVLSNDPIVEDIRKVALTEITFALLEARIALNLPASELRQNDSYGGFHSSPDNFCIRAYASEALVRRTAKAAEALCLEYLVEMK